MRTEFLSDEWFERLRSALRETTVDGDLLRLGIVVTHVPPERGGDDVQYTLVIGGGAPGSVENGSVAGADVVLVESFADASRLAAGEITAAQLLETGRIKVRGDSRRLVAATDKLAAVGARLA